MSRHRLPTHMGLLRGMMLGLLLAAAQPSSALAHASLLVSDPAPNAVLARSPASLTLTFNEAVEPLRIQIIDGHGAASAAPHIERRGASLVVMQPATLATGAYVLSWRVISEDGHPVGGALPFWVGARTEAAPLLATSNDNPVRVAIWVTRLALYLGLFVGAGGAFFLAWMTLPGHVRVARRVTAAALVAGLIAAALSVGLQGLDALAAPLSALSLPDIWKAGVQGSFGRSIAIAALALIAALLSLRGRYGLAKILSLPGLLGVGVALAATGHAATASPRWLALASVVLHGTSLAFWIGALVPLACLMRKGDDVTMPLMRFSRAIPWAIAALLLSGLFLSIVQVQNVAALWTTTYGRILAVKLVLVFGLLGIALWNRVALTPLIASGTEPPRRRMRISIICELVLVGVILGIVGFWRFAPPPRLLVGAVDDFFVHIHSEKAMANATITPGSAGPVEIVVQLETSDERPLTAMGLSVTLSNPDVGIEPATAQAERMDDGRWRARLTATVPGRWMLGLGILISDFDKVDVEAPILIK